MEIKRKVTPKRERDKKKKKRRRKILLSLSPSLSERMREGFRESEHKNKVKIN